MYGSICNVFRPSFQWVTTFVVSRSRGYKTFFMLNSTEYEIFLLINDKMPTIVGMLTFMSGKNSILSLSEPEKCQIS